jgi:hypothetical protein
VPWAGGVAVPSFLDEFRVLATSGSSGRKGLFVYDRARWTTYVAQFVRFVAATGRPPWRSSPSAPPWPWADPQARP